MTPTLNSVREDFLLVTLGGFSLRRRSPVDGVDWIDTGLGEKPCVLLAFLGLVHTPVPRPLLCELLWHHVDGPRARNSLRQSLFRIRRLLGARAIVETTEGVLLGRGVMAIDLLRAVHGTEGLAPNRPLGAELAEAFGYATRPMGPVFEEWRSRVRYVLAKGDHATMLPMHLDETTNAARGILRAAGSEPSPRQRLEQLYRLSAHGIPVTVWATGRSEHELQHQVERFAQSCLAQGACVAAVPRRPGMGYLRSALERDLAEALWPLPGAVGIKPEHRAALDGVARDLPVEYGLLRTALTDLIAAVAENAPLVITLGDPGRYSSEALATLVTDLVALRDRAVMLLLADYAGGRPVHSTCIEVRLTGGSPMRGAARTTPASGQVRMARPSGDGRRHPRS